MQRRDLLRVAGGIGAAGAAGVGGTFFLTGGAAAEGDAELQGLSGDSITTGDGEIEYVGYGGLVRFEWENLDAEATRGEIETLSTVQGDSGWHNHGTDSGPLGDDPSGSESNHNNDGEFDHGEENTSNTWGGGNDTNSGAGKNGFFQFKFGHPFGQRDYAIAYDSEEYDAGDTDFQYGDAIATQNPWSTSHFESNSDGDNNQTTVTIKQVCRVYDADGAQLVEAEDSAKFDIGVTNKAATGDTSGHINGSVAGDAKN